MAQIEQYLKVSRVLHKHDPMGLISMGAPHDEYESEAVFICDWVKESPRIDIRGAEGYLTSLLYGTFILYFGADMVPSEPEVWAPIAKDLVSCFRWRSEEETKNLVTGE